MVVHAYIQAEDFYFNLGHNLIPWGWFVAPQKNSMIEIIREEHPELFTDGKEMKIVHRYELLSNYINALLEIIKELLKFP